MGLHNPQVERLDDRFATLLQTLVHHALKRAGMRCEFIQELRGDSRKEAIDIYDHIDLKELKEAYQACIPQGFKNYF